MIFKLFFSKINYNFKKLDITLTILLFISIGFGVILIKNYAYTTLQKFNFIFSSDFAIKSNSSFISNFLSSLNSSAIFSIIIILSSLSLIGIIGIFATILFKGLGLGIIFGDLYISYGLKNIFIGTCLLLPGAFVAIISLIFLASESLRFNILILKKIYFNQDKNDIFFFDYIKKIAISGIILIIAAFFDSCLITGLANFFDF